MSKLPRDIGCSVADCDGRTYARGFCRRHYPLQSRHYYKPRFRRGRVSCKRSVAENLEACSERDPATGCLLWIGARDGDYGAYGSKRRAHRVAYEEAKGPIPPGLFVCHSCDTPLCIESDHLFLGTTQENTADCFQKGRQGLVTKLSPDQVRAIRNDRRPRPAVAAEYGVSSTTIRRICNGKSWRFVA